MLEPADFSDVERHPTQPHNRFVPDEKRGRGRRKVIAPALGKWLGYFRRLTPYTQDGAADPIGISGEGVKRIERGENVGIELLLPFLSWLEEELAATQPKRYHELKDGLFERLIEAGAEIRKQAAAKKGDPKSPQPRAAVGERERAKGRTRRIG